MKELQGSLFIATKWLYRLLFLKTRVRYVRSGTLIVISM
jgi:hypothetical protein